MEYTDAKVFCIVVPDAFGRANKFKTEKRNSSLKDFYLVLLPYDFYNVIPPLNILNQILQETEEDESGEKLYYPIGACVNWEPFVLTSDEYEELRDELFTSPNLQYKEPVLPGWVQSPRDWAQWQRSVE